MGKTLFLFGILALSSCGTIDRMNSLVNQSTYAIQENGQAIAQSTEQIRQNQADVEGSTRALQENKKLLDAAGG
jgi:hypothetical protein